MKALVIWFAIYQAGHLVVNALYFLGAMPFPPAPAGGAWHAQLLPFFRAMGALDMLVCVASLWFAALYLRRGEGLALGLVSTTASLYSAALFTYGCAMNGTWKAGVAEQVVGNALYLPVPVLFVLLARRASPVSRSTAG